MGDLTSPIAALVLAAGASTRFGRPKQLVDWGGRPLLEHVLAQVAAWPVSSVTVVLGAGVEEILSGVDFGDATVVENLEWSEGIASSLRVGLDALTREAKTEAALLALGDQPSIPEDVVAALVDRFLGGECRAVVPRYRYAWSNPVIVDRSLWPRIMSLEGDSGAQRLLRAHADWVCEVLVDHLPPRDIDTAADVDELRPRG